MSDQDLVTELKATIKDLTEEKEDLHLAIRHKESRLKQLTIKFEQTNHDLKSAGREIAKKDKQVTSLQKKVVAKEKIINNKDDDSIEDINEKIETDNKDEEDKE